MRLIVVSVFLIESLIMALKGNCSSWDSGLGKILRHQRFEVFQRGSNVLSMAKKCRHGTGGSVLFHLFETFWQTASPHLSSLGEFFRSISKCSELFLCQSSHPLKTYFWLWLWIKTISQVHYFPCFFSMLLQPGTSWSSIFGTVTTHCRSYELLTPPSLSVQPPLVFNMQKVRAPQRTPN